MTFPICDIFTPTVYNGQQCYRVDAKNNKKQPGRRRFDEGKRSGLFLLLDVNSERSIDIEKPKRNRSTERRLFIGYDHTLSRKNLAIIHIGARNKFTGYGPGEYALSSIKQMTGTENFLAWPKNKRGCALQKYEECKIKGLLGEITQCGCSPFHLFSTSDVDQVHTFLDALASFRPILDSPLVRK